ncbi:MAG: cyclic nucleotide-binding domain-containing protein, partial [Flavobacteriaceae bacterium]|nr:cyclic nucleotide-binding domain-containing protein [Flavobacteriaceae bacterium]
GADDYITKPFNEEELISAIESRLAKASILKDIREKHQEKSIKSSEREIRTLIDLKNFFDKNGQIFHYSDGDTIYKEGNHSNAIYLILKGVVKCYKLDELGKELITALPKKDELFGYTSFIKNIPYQESATAIKDTELISVSKQALKDILENNHKVTLELIELLNTNLSDIKDQLLQMAYGSVTIKTAATILKFAEKLNKSPEEPIKISRSDLASVAGIAKETFIRTMTIFKKDGLIEIEGRNIKILDINKLKHLI